MYERIVDILIYLLLEIRKSQSLQEIDLSQLEKDGYTTTEISAALSLLFEKMNFSDTNENRIATTSPESHRTFHDVEKLAMDVESRGFLLQLRELNLINDLELEYIIERVMLSGFSNASVDDVKAIVSSVFIFSRKSFTIITCTCA